MTKKVKRWVDASEAIEAYEKNIEKIINDKRRAEREALRVDPITSRGNIEKVKRYLLKKDERYHLIFVLGINSGLRISDIVSLKVKQIYKKEYVYVKEQKTGKTNKVIINDSAKEAIDKYCCNLNKEDYLFPSQKGKYLKEKTVYKELKKAFKKCRLKGNFGTHTLRKTHAWHVNDVAGLEMAQWALNHENQSDTLRYLGIQQKALDKVIGGLNL
ncbi:tyrosine-type recombinase/integrase [Clostridioides difficile]|nr:tyrosine-type recombinase/integrase [Clostridioides difficile]HEL7585453.1 tyrosine-type recombinase/integrase [Clostridioides difficile]